MRQFRPEYSPDMRLIVGREFTLDGVVYQSGQPFPADALSQKQARRLYNQRRLNAAPSESAPKAYVPPARSAPEGVRTQHRGFGRWYVVDGAAVVSGPHSKKDAEAVLEGRLPRHITKADVPDESDDDDLDGAEEGDAADLDDAAAA